MPELQFLRTAHHLTLINIYMKFREDSLNGFQVIERIRMCDRRTDRRPGEKQYVSPKKKISGGDIIIIPSIN